MALIERLMGDPFETDDLKKIPVHSYYAVLIEISQGRLTRQMVKDYWEMSPEDEAEFDLLMNSFPSNAALQQWWSHRQHTVLLLAEVKFPGYETPALVRAKLGI